MFDYEFRIFHLRRSGGHGFVHWLAGHFNLNDVLYYNDLKTLDIKKIDHEKNNNIKKIENISFYRTDYPNGIDLQNDEGACIIHTYEDRKLEDIEEIDKNTNGISKQTKNIVIVRDPFNLTASRIKSKESGRNWCPINDKYIKLANSYYNAFSKKSIFGDFRTIYVDYNKWISSIKYRENISYSLNLKPCDLGFGIITKHGRGSSFDKGGKEIKDMNLMKRWEKYVGHKKMEYVLENIDLSIAKESLIHVDYFYKKYNCMKKYKDYEEKNNIK